MWLNFPFKKKSMFRRTRFFVDEKKTDVSILKVTTNSLYCCFSTKTQCSSLVIKKLGRRCEGTGIDEGDLSKWNQEEIIEISQYVDNVV